VISRTSALTAISPEALRGKSVGAIEGTQYATYLADVYAPKGATVKLYRTEADARTDLRDGNIAALFGGAIRLYRWLDEGASGRCCRFLGPSVRSPKILGEGAGIAIRKEDGDLREMFNRALADILRDGTYDKINAMYFNFLIY
jgi:polar amino acid transport system substrate-binding protein